MSSQFGDLFERVAGMHSYAVQLAVAELFAASAEVERMLRFGFVHAR